jgi:PIN domain nuclease of toxin-antitoxin system
MILVDTHVVLWLAEAPERLSSNAKEAISTARAKDGLAIADKTLWELAMIIHLAKDGRKFSGYDFLSSVERNFVVMPITALIAEQAMQFSESYPKDPTDRLIGATAVVNGLSLITKDEKIRRSGEVRCIW